jgi:hypothetical protein
MPLNFQRIDYKTLNHRQKENHNDQKVSAVFADFGFLTIRLSDDYNGADFIAYHYTGESIYKVQLKGRLFVNTKYKDKDIWGCFNYKNVWYLYPHDEFLRWILKNTTVATTKDWVDVNDWKKIKGAYDWPSPPENILNWLKGYAIQ